jgi:hypothetical protein
VKRALSFHLQISSVCGTHASYDGGAHGAEKYVSALRISSKLSIHGGHALSRLPAPLSSHARRRIHTNPTAHTRTNQAVYATPLSRVNESPHASPWSAAARLRLPKTSPASARPRPKAAQRARPPHHHCHPRTAPASHLHPTDIRGSDTAIAGATRISALPSHVAPTPLGAPLLHFVMPSPQKPHKSRIS